MAKEKFRDYTAVQVLTWRYQSLLAGIAESVMCPALSHMARVYFHKGALSCIMSDLLAVKLSELRTDHLPLSNTEAWNAESFRFMPLL